MASAACCAAWATSSARVCVTTPPPWLPPGGRPDTAARAACDCSDRARSASCGTVDNNGMH